MYNAGEGKGKEGAAGIAELKSLIFHLTPLALRSELHSQRQLVNNVSRCLRILQLEVRNERFWRSCGNGTGEQAQQASLA
jgi:hypothetical protein